MVIVPMCLVTMGTLRSLYTSEVIVLRPLMPFNLVMSPQRMKAAAPWREKGLFVRPGGGKVKPQLR